MSVETNGRRISRSDLEAAFSKVIGDGQATTRQALPQVAVVAGAVALAVTTVAYVLGRRGGRKRSAVLEIRRL